MKQTLEKILGRNRWATAAIYCGLALVLLAIVPAQPRLHASGAPCGDCPEGAVCIGNDETGYYCGCVAE
jgi:hypothetical protein